jgi:hypothetical protein
MASARRQRSERLLLAWVFALALDFVADGFGDAARHLDFVGDAPQWKVALKAGANLPSSSVRSRTLRR